MYSHIMVMEKRIAKFELTLTRSELLHIRDLMSVIIPSHEGLTVSEALAEAEGRTLIDVALWEKVSCACGIADLALEGDAPDYVISPTSIPMMGIFRVQDDEELVMSECDPREDENDGEDVSSGTGPLRGDEQADEGVPMPGGGGDDEANPERKRRRVHSGDRKRRRAKRAI
jgi:hypothetical protein